MRTLRRRGFGLKTRRLAAPTAVPGVLLVYPRVVALGDSNTQYGSELLLGETLSNTDNGDIPLLAGITGQLNIDIFYDYAADNVLWQGSNAGVAGIGSGYMAQRIDDLLLYPPDILYLAGGTNDGLDTAGGGSGAAPAYTDMATAAHNGGVAWVVFRACPPVGGVKYSLNRHLGRLAFNTVIRDFALANPTWCKYADIYTPHIDGVGEAIAGYVEADGVHLSEYGAALNAYVLQPIFASIVASTNDLATSYISGALTSNSGILTGTGGIAAGGVTGSIPSGWTATRTGTSTVASALSANAQTGGQTMTLSITPSAGVGSDTVTFTPTDDLVLTGGQWYLAWYEVEVGKGATDLKHPCSMATITRVDAQPGSNLFPRQYLRTPPFKATGLSKPTIEITIPQGETAYTVKIHRVIVLPYTSPYVTWNVPNLPVRTGVPSVLGTVGTGNVVTLTPATYTGLTTGIPQARRYRADFFRNGVFVSTITWPTAIDTYTQVEADLGNALTFKFSAANKAEGRTAEFVVAFPPDVTAPTLSSALAAQGAATITLDYNETLAPAPPATSAYTITNSGGADTVVSVAITGTTVTITKSRTTMPGDTITINYTAPVTNPIADNATNATANLTGQAVTVTGTVAPTRLMLIDPYLTSDNGKVRYATTLEA